MEAQPKNPRCLISSQSSAPVFFFCAAEHSGDALGASLINALRVLHPQATFVGIGGPRMAAAGCRLLANPVARSAMLLGAIFSQSRYWYKLLKLLDRELATLKPHVVIPIDSSFVNLRVAAAAKARKIPVCYYVAPQLWASRPGRIAKVRARVDTLCCILPFEEAYFRNHGVHAVYVGHPMFDTPADTPDTDPAQLDPPLPNLFRPEEEAAGSQSSLPSTSWSPRVALFPGSRESEIRANLPPMLAILTEIKGRFPRTAFVAAAPSEDRAWQIRKHLRAINAPVDIRVGHADAIIRWADLCIVKSGTATLQVARHHKPMVVMFAVPRWLWAFARWLINTRFIALVNILANRALVPEFIPFYGSPLPVARTAIALLADPARRAAMSRDLAVLVAPLHPAVPGGAAARVATEVTKLIGTGG